MNTFSIIRDALAQTENDPDKVGLREDIIETGRILAAVQTVVDALTPPDGGRYVVGFKNINTAGTSLLERTITVSSKPLSDPSLTIVEKAVVIATFAAHEIGHTLVTRPRKFPVNLVIEHNSHSGYHTVANIADDIILEPFMVDLFPILRDAFAFTGGWVLRNTGETNAFPIVDTLHAGTTAAERFNHLLHATRYGDIPEIVWSDDKMRAERDWYRDWATRLLALPLTNHTAFLAQCDEVWERIRTVDPEPEPEPEPEEGEDPEPGDERGDEPGTERGDEPGDRQGDDFDEVEPDPEDGDEPGDGDGDEDGDDGDGDTEDEPEPGEGKGDAEGDDGDDIESEPEEGDDEGDCDNKGDESGDEPGDESEYDGHEESGDQRKEREGGGGNAEADRDDVLRDEDDFNQTEVDQTTHDQAEQTGFDGDLIEAKVRTYASTTATAFGRHGRMTTTWD